MNPTTRLAQILAAALLVAGGGAAVSSAASNPEYSAGISFGTHPAVTPIVHATAVASPGPTSRLPFVSTLHFTTTGSFTIGTHFVVRIKPFSGTATTSGRSVTVKLSTAERHLIRVAARRYGATHVELTTSTSVVGSPVKNRTETSFKIPGL
jgi:hypothetical protein